jgi:hypothetical protein
MKRYYFNILLLFCSAFYIGCTSTYIVATRSLQTERDTITINRLQQKLQDKTFKIILHDNRQVQAENITFSKDTATFTIIPDLKQNSIPFTAIQKIERRLHFDGAFVGAFLSSVVAGTAGFIYWRLCPPNSNESWGKVIDDVGRDIGYPTIFGFFAGGIYGGIRGNIEEYIFDSDFDKHAP